MTESTIQQKPCCTCKVVKPLGEFHKASDQKDGRYPQCAECSCKRRQNAWLKRQPDFVSLFGETWKPIAGFADYEVSDFGRVRRMTAKNGVVHKGRLMRPSRVDRYWHVTLSVNGQSHYFMVHRLVAQAFLPPPQNPLQIWVNHIDADMSNCHVHNLEWCTPKENTEHSVSLGRMVRGERVHTAKLTEDQVRDIRGSLKTGIGASAIARTYGVHHATVQSIKSGQSWKHVD